MTDYDAYWTVKSIPRQTGDVEVSTNDMHLPLSTGAFTRERSERDHENFVEYLPLIIQQHC